MAVINEDLHVGIHPPATVGLIIQTVGNQRVAASIWQTDYGDGQAGLVDPAYASTLYHRSVGRFLPRNCGELLGSTWGARVDRLSATTAASIAHPFWVMLPWPPHGTMTATTPDGKRMG